MSLLWILPAIFIAWIMFKIGMKTLKWVVILILALIVFWFFFAGGGVKIEKPDGMPELPSLPTFTK